MDVNVEAKALEMVEAAVAKLGGVAENLYPQLISYLYISNIVAFIISIVFLVVFGVIAAKLIKEYKSEAKWTRDHYGVTADFAALTAVSGLGGIVSALFALTYAYKLIMLLAATNVVAAAFLLRLVG